MYVKYFVCLLQLRGHLHLTVAIFPTLLLALCQPVRKVCLWTPADSNLASSSESWWLAKADCGFWLYWFCRPMKPWANLPDIFLYILINFLKFCLQDMYVLVIKHIFFKNQYIYLETSSNLNRGCQLKELFFLSHLKISLYNTPASLNTLLYIFYTTTIHSSK